MSIPDFKGLPLQPVPEGWYEALSSDDREADQGSIQKHVPTQRPNATTNTAATNPAGIN